MIAQLTGRISQTDMSSVVLDVNGVGYLVNVTGKTLSQLTGRQDEVCLLTDLQVREDSMTLFGFLSETDRQAFKLLQTVQGVGAKAALSILTVLTADELATAILSADKAMVSRADGVGPKLAARIVNELAQKTASLTPPSLGMPSAAGSSSDSPSSDSAAAPQTQPVFNDALSALCNLGYSRSEAFAALQSASSDEGTDDLSQLIAAGLRHLAT